MSNPFLVDLEESYTPYSSSGTQTPYSGGTTPKRRNSTNPFEILSPDVDDPDGTKNFASAIADMSADFFQSISGKTTNNNEFTADEDVFEDVANNSTSKTVKTITTTSTAYVDNGSDSGTIFDPFQTIHDDDGNFSSKRSSIEQQQRKESSSTNDDDMMMSNSTKITGSASSKAKDMFNTSITELAQQQEQQQSSIGDLLGTRKQLEPYLSDLSDLSDLSPVATQEENHDGTVRSAFDAYSAVDDEETKFTPITSSEILLRRISVANRKFDEDDDDDEAEEEEIQIIQQQQTGEQIDKNITTTVTSQQQSEPYFDPFTTTFTDSPITVGEDGEYDDPHNNKELQEQLDDQFVPDVQSQEEPITKQMKAMPSSGIRSRLDEQYRTDSIDLNYVGQPNINAKGFVNDAFSDSIMDTSDGAYEDHQAEQQQKRKSSVDIAEVDVENLQPSSLRELVSTTMDTDSIQPDKLIEVKEEKRESKDPFDTSEFDSKAFEAFESRFEAAEVEPTKIKSTVDDPFASPYKIATKVTIAAEGDDDDKNLFDTFEPFVPKQPENTPYKVAKKPKKKRDSFEDSDSFDDDDDDDEPMESFRIVIRDKNKDSTNSNTDQANLALPLLPPPPKSPKRLPQQQDQDQNKEEHEEVNEEDLILTGYRSKIKPKKTAKSFIDEEFDRFFASSENRRGSEAGEPTTATTNEEPEWPTSFGGESYSKQRAAGGDSPASPQTPLYDEDTSQPLEDFPPPYLGEGWEMMLRHPAKKKLTANRYWKKIFVRFIPDTCVLQLFNKKGDAQPFQELPLQASYSLSEMQPQQYDQYGKIFTVKVQYIFYRERVGVRPGQIAKVMQGQIQSMGDIARLGMPVEHSPQISELLKIGSLEYNDIKELVTLVEESMFRMTVHRDRALTYRTEEIQCCVQDECFVEQNKMGIVEKQLARVRLFFLGFLNGMPVIEIGINDLRRQGKEVVGRHDIIPVVTEEWIRVERPEFHACVQDNAFDESQVIRLIPPDACSIEMMRFRIRPPKNRELPLQVTASMNITPSKMELKCDILVPGCISRKHGQIPCEDIVLRFHIPECWIYFFRVEKHFRYGAVHSTNRRSGKLKGLDRILGTATNPEPQLIEVTAGLAKYEHAYHSIVWRIPKLPKDGQGAYTQQLMLVRLPLSSFDRIPETFYDFVHVEFRMPSTTVSHTTLRSVSVNCETPPEKFVRYVAKYEYKIGLNITYDENKPEPEYLQVTAMNNGSVKKEEEQHSSEDEQPEEPDE